MRRGTSQTVSTAAKAMILAIVACTTYALSVPYRSQKPDKTDAPAPNVIRIEPNQPVKLDFSPGQTRIVQFSLGAGQYTNLSLDQRQTSLIAELTSPRGAKIIEANNRPRLATDIEHLPFIATESGTYNLTLKTNKTWGGPWTCEIKLQQPETATPQDESRVALWKAYQSGIQLIYERTPEARPRAIEQFTTALQLARDLGDRVQEGKVLFNLSSLYRGMKELQKSDDYRNQSLAVLRDSGDDSALADELLIIGIQKDGAGMQRDAIATFQETVSLGRSSGNLAVEAAALGNIGGCYSTLGEYDQALSYLQRAVELLRKLGIMSSLYYNLSEIGRIYSLQGNVQGAIAAFDETFQISQQAGDDPPCKPLFKAGFLYYSLSDWQSAAYYLEKALPSCQKLNYEDEAVTLAGLGSVYGQLGDTQKANQYFEDALAKDRARKMAWGEAIALAGRGQFRESLGYKQQALADLTAARTLFHDNSDPLLESSALNSLGNIHLSLKETDKAKEEFSQALEISRRIGDPNNEAAALLGLSMIERDSGRMEAALADAKRSLAIVESLRIKIPSYTLRSSYFASVNKNYETYIDLLMRMHHQDASKGFAATAMEVNERSRARSLIEMLNESNADIRQGVPPELLNRERNIKEALNAKTSEQILLLSSLHQKEKAADFKKAIDSLTVQYSEIQSEIRSTSPRYAALTQPQTLTVREIQEQVLDPDTLLLEYSLGDEHSFLWTVTPTSLDVYELPKRKEIEASAQRVLNLLTARQQTSGEMQSSGITQADSDYWTEAAALSKTLLGPVVAQLGNKRLAVVASGALQYIPFAALPEPVDQKISDHRPLIFDHEIVSLPSASLLAIGRRNLQKRTAATKSLAVIADPVFEKNDPRIKQFATKTSTQPPTSQMGNVNQNALLRATREVEGSDSRGFSRLLYSRVEANKILSTVGDQSDRFAALDFAANRKTAFSAELGKYRYIHFATHGLLDEVHPELSGLVLSLVDEKGQQQDGFLRLHDIYNLKLSADLVVLSACRTGLGKQIKGEGLVGLTQGFMYAGSPRVVASLWKVQDDSTAELMTSFYNAMLKEGKRPAAALREAQLAMLRKKQWQAPFYWAAFVIQGEWK